MADSDVTHVLKSMCRGESIDSDQLLPLVYEELRRLANRKLAEEGAGHTLQPTALVHEAYLRLVAGEANSGWENRGHFYAAAAEAMRRILIEGARRKASLKRGGDHQRIGLPKEFAEVNISNSEELLNLDEALEKLKQIDPESFQLVMLRYFGGLTVDKAAETLGVSPRTVKRNWSFARAWLQREISRISQ